MSESSDNVENITTKATTSEYTPFVRYGFPKDSERPRQSATLYPIDEPIPEEAETASPVYLLTNDQVQRQQSLENPYAVKGAKNIATPLQDECEESNRVIYPLHIETDNFEEVPHEVTARNMAKFVESELGCAATDCTFYFSGRRSIHAHVPRVVTTEYDRKQVKAHAKRFCDETGAEFDLSLYDRKSQFRLPGVRHQKTSLWKVEIDPKWDRDRIMRETSSRPEKPPTYAEVLSHVFTPQTSEGTDTARSLESDGVHVLQNLLANGAEVCFNQTKRSIEPPVVEQKQRPVDPANMAVWEQYNHKEFSPYAHADGNPRSVAVVRVLGGAFARKEKRDGATMIPAYFYGARGCNGGEFTKEAVYSPLQLSAHDYSKWDYGVGDYVVVIGGRSRNSIIHEVTPWQGVVAGHTLKGEEGSRQAALDYLTAEGYDVGTGGSGNTTRGSKRAGTSRRQGDIPPVQNPQTEAARLQQQAEQDGIQTLSHEEQGRVACRVLRYGWEPAWKWFKTQYGPDFNRRVTWTQFKSVVETYAEDYTHVEVPSKPP